MAVTYRSSVVELVDRFCRIAGWSVSGHNGKRLERQPGSAIGFADLHKPATRLAPFRQCSVVNAVETIRATRGFVVRRINVPMCLNIGALPVTSLNNLPMPDAVDLTCQTPFDRLAPVKSPTAWNLRPVGAVMGRFCSTGIEPKANQCPRLLQSRDGSSSMCQIFEGKRISSFAEAFCKNFHTP
jgi:hypothetical protein